MENNIKIKELFIKQFNEMIEDIETCGRTDLCPNWCNSLYDNGVYRSKTHCTFCYMYFKKLKSTSTKERHGFIRLNNCPCDHYTSAYLVRFLKKIISNSEIKGE